MTRSQALQLHLSQDLRILAPVVCDDLLRLGRCSDGGYVVPKAAVTQADVLLSMGINDDWSFEKSFLATNPTAKIHAYDHTISGSIFRKRILLAGAGCLLGRTTLRTVFHRIGVYKDYRTFFQGRVHHYQERVRNRLDESTDADLTKMLERANGQQYFIKMDIEGAEYRMVDSLVSHADSLVGMVIEFHDTEPFRSVLLGSIERLLDRYQIVHVHGNNYGGIGADGLPEVLEISFERSDFCRSRDRRANARLISLDRPNNPDKPDYELVFS